MKGSIDHLMWACADLDAGMASIESLTGMTPAAGGPHPGFGTRNALLDLGHQTYLEIIAPDREQSLEGNFGAELAALEAPYLRTWAVRVTDLGATRDLLNSLGLETRGPTAMSRALPGGELISWELLFLSALGATPGATAGGTDGAQGAFVGGTLPFFIDWKGSRHPCANLEPGCELAGLEIETTEVPTLERIADAFELELTLSAAAQDRLRATLSTPRGSVSLR